MEELFQRNVKPAVDMAVLDRADIVNVTTFSLQNLGRECLHSLPRNPVEK